MLQFAFMLFSANALKCNMWQTANGMTTDLPDQECMAAAGMTTCVSYSYKITLTGQTDEMSVNTGSCGTATFCSDFEAATKLTGQMSDWECTSCDAEKCNTKSTGGASEPASEPAADSKKSFYMEETTGENGPMRCSMMTTENDCTAQKFIDLGVEGVKEGSCPAKYTTKCALKYTEKDEDGNDEVTDLPSDMDKSMSDVIGCGKITMSGMTLDCDGCQKQKELAPTGATFQKDPVCDPAPGTDGSTDNSGSALAFGLAALVASLFY